METEKKKKLRKVILVIVLAIAVLAAGCFIWTRNSQKETEKTTTTSSENSLTVSSSKSYSASGEDGTLTSVEIAAKVKPSVIAVLTYQDGSLEGEGSGIVMSVDKDQGVTYILTCAHIINSSGITCQVQLEDGTSYDATVVGYDSRTDVGVLRIKTTDLTAAEFGDSTVLQVGEPVYAIGNPGGTQFYGSFTAGVISAIDRPTSSSESGYTMECIQHDAAINPGNSGGALVNSYGQVIGMNSSKIASEEYEGMGFAIPISVVKDVVDDILQYGYVQDRAKLGISYVAASSYQTYYSIVQQNNLPSGSIVIAKMDSDSSFSGTDVQAGDMIIAVDGEDMDKTDVLLNKIDDSKPGDTLKLTIAHVNNDYSVSTFDVTVTLKEDTGSTSSSSSSSEDSSSSGGFQNPFSGN